jgi:hypothetical protein
MIMDAARLGNLILDRLEAERASGSKKPTGI